ncbi:MAG: hypothetical protein AAGF27_05920 [Pseudomonadota bacterium]
MILSAASKVLTKIAETEKKGDGDGDNIIKRTLGLADSGIPIGREDEPAGYVRWKAAENDQCNSGQTGSAGTPVKYLEFLWSQHQTIDECEWGTVRWRFYANGLVCFDARMANTSGKLDNGDVQGFRIELREKNGLLLGVWIAGFFVRRSLPLRGFAASFSDDHAPLKLHFDDIDDTQLGAWICL